MRPAMVKLDLARHVLKETERRSGVHWSTLLASRLLALTAARPGVVRIAEVNEFEDLDGKKPIWRVPAAKMKLTRQRKRDVTWEFVIPLSRQRSEEHTSELQSLMRISYAVFCLKNKSKQYT